VGRSYIYTEYRIQGNTNNPVVILRSRWSPSSSDSVDRGRSIIRVMCKEKFEDTKGVNPYLTSVLRTIGPSDQRGVTLSKA